MLVRLVLLGSSDESCMPMDVSRDDLPIDSTGDPKKRQQGAIQYIGILGLLGLSVTTILKVANLL